MIREAIVTGDTVELAIETGCKELGIETHEAQFDIIDMPIKKTLGLFGGNPAKVRVYIENSPAESAVTYLKSILGFMGAPPVEITVEEVEGGAILSLNGEGLGFIIGRHGETLDALQYLSGLVANHVDNSYYRITLNMGNYREKREKTLQALAKKMAGKALKYGRNLRLEPMNPYERRIIHTAVQEVEGTKSWSEGEDLNRHVVIGPEAGERSFRPRSDSRGRSDFRGGRSDGPGRNNNYRGDNRAPGGPRNDFRSGGGQSDRRGPSTQGASVPSAAPSAFSSPSSPSSSTQEPRAKSPTESSGGPLYGRIDVKKDENSES